MISKFVVLLGIFAFTYAQKTPVYVYYESLCPDSQAFITKQLSPTMELLKDHVDLKLIPYGKSTHQTQGSDVIFQCHHGPNECYGNKIHACAIDHIQVDSFQRDNTRESLTVKYINCLMTDVSEHEPYADFARRCADTVHVKNFESILKCANDTEGSKLLELAGESTEKVFNGGALINVPTITIRETFDASIQKRSLENFSSAVCENLPKPMPAVCHEFSSAAGISSSFILAAAAVFVTIFIRMF